MTIAFPNPHFYKVGGSLGFAHPSYVTRRADDELLSALQDRQFCYVFNCRQMGKSSLRVRSMQLLSQSGMLCAAIDMTMLGSYVNPQQWYGGIITQLFQGFSLLGTVNLKSWLQEHCYLSPAQQLSEFISDVILRQTGDRPLFIFIDEIDKILSLEFSVDDFFALVRFFYNQRAENPAFQRITFALFGVATPSDLIRDKTQTLFNIGHAIELTGFSLAEAHPLALGIQDCCDRPQVVLAEILRWTGGQPFLTQKLCQLILKAQYSIHMGQEAEQIKTLVQSKIIDHWETQDEPVHFKTIRDRLLRHPSRIARQLTLYQRILQQEDVASGDSFEATELRLSGLVVQQDEKLHVYNQIYAQIFNSGWVESQLKKIRPYAEAIRAWETSNRQDESRLLRGNALRDALQWSESKKLSTEDYQFLAASQELDKRTALAQERRRQDVERLELELAAEQKAKAELSQAYRQAQKRLRLASIILVASIVGAAIATGWLGYVLRREQVTQVESLRWAGKGALSQFEFSQIDALLTAMEASEQLSSQMQDNQPLEAYPTYAPITALQTILNRIQERNHLIGHNEPINSVSISPNGQLIATASRDGTAKIWSIQGQVLKTLTPQNGSIYGVSFSPDSRSIATGANDGTVKIWSVNGSLQRTLTHDSEVYSVKFSRDGKWIAIASKSGRVKLWNRQNMESKVFQAHPQAIYSIEFSPDSQRILTASQDRTAKLWQIDGTLVRSLQSQDTLYSASFSPEGQQVVIAGRSGVIELWMDNQLIQRFQGHQSAIYDVGFDPTGNFLVTTSADETVKIWSLSGRLIQTLQGYQGAVYDASFSHGSLLVTASHDKDAKLWDFSQFPLVDPLSNPPEVAALALGPEDQLATAFAGGIIRIISLLTGQARTLKTQSSAIYDITIHPQYDQIFVAFKDGQVESRNFQGQSLKQFQAHQDIIYSIAVHPTRNLIATSSRDKTVKLWTPMGQIQTLIQAHDNAVYDVKFSPDGQWIATASGDETAKVWSLDGQVQATLVGHQGEIHQVAFSPDSQRLVTVSADETARVWNLAGEELLQLQHETGLIFRVRFSPDGQVIATGSKDGTIHIWNMKGQLLDQLQGHQSLVMGLEFTSENRLISIAQEDNEARIWPQSQSASQRLEYLLKEGCQWLNDYLKHQPKRAPKSCRLLSKSS